jgi:hypothetical protein
MLTLFTIPKPFEGHIEIIQRNAIQSWCKLQPKCEIILFGDDLGVTETAREFDLIHVPNINKTEYGTPLLDFVFQQAQGLASNDLLCYVNSDIIFLSDFLPSFKKIGFECFLTAGQRWDLEIKSPLDFQDKVWENRLKLTLAKDGCLHPKAGIDYFVFTRNWLGSMPPFAVGRVGWDNWFIYNSRARKVPVIDATSQITAIHQNHDYSHIPKKTGQRWEGPESTRNLELMERKIYEWSLEDADWTLSENGPIKKPLTNREICRRITLITPTTFHPILEELFQFQHNLRNKRSS